MTNVQEALKAAIEYLTISDAGYDKYEKALSLCKTALSELEKCEPVYLARRIGTGLDYFTCNKQRFDELSVNKLFHTKTVYTSPISKEWVGLSEAQENELSDLAYEKGYGDIELIRSAEAKLKELNP